MENIREIKIMRGMHGKRRGKEKRGKSIRERRIIYFSLNQKLTTKKRKTKVFKCA